MRQLALLHFRNTITLSVKLEGALARTHARVPPAIVQMLLVLQVGGAPGRPPFAPASGASGEGAGGKARLPRPRARDLSTGEREAGGAQKVWEEGGSSREAEPGSGHGPTAAPSRPSRPATVPDVSRARGFSPRGQLWEGAGSWGRVAWPRQQRIRWATDSLYRRQGLLQTAAPQAP